MNSRLERARRLRPLQLALAAGAAAASSAAFAAPIDVGNDDLAIRWDNTLKYSVGVRAKDRSSTLVDVVPPLAGGSPGPNALNGDDGDRNFKRGGLISNRIDVLSEFDAVYKRDFGARISAAGWYDSVYNKSNSNDSPATFNPISVPNNEFPDGTRRLHGRKAEVLDAFVFGATDIGDTRLSGRLGKHTVLWGESLFFGNNGIAGTQSPVDAVKASSVPGSTTKEVVMPVNQLSGQLQIAPNLSLMGYYQLEWRRTRLPGAGSYFSTSDVLDAGGERLRAGGTAVGVPGSGFLRGPDVEAKDSGQGGLGLKTRLANVDVGLYALRFHAKTPVLYVRPGAVTGVPAAALGNYQLVFAQGINAYGASATTTVGLVNFAVEASVRRGTPLTSNAQTIPAAIAADNDKNPFYAIGNSAHLQASVLWTLPPMFISAEPSLSAEVAFNRMTSCTQNCTPSAANNNRPTGALDPNASRDAVGGRFSFAAPQRNVLNGLDLTPAITAAYYRGRSSVVVFGPDKGGDVTLSLAGNYLAVWDITLAYTAYYGPTNTTSYASTNAQVNGTNTYAQALRDRNFVSLSIRRAL